MSSHLDTGAPLEPQRKLTPTERLHEVTMASLHRKSAEPESSVSITRNAKGDAQFEVVVRGIDAEACEQLATTIYDRLVELYPRAAEANGAKS